jgi:dipeptidyl aminopeptidase/acylaminoacyl peptidase
MRILVVLAFLLVAACQPQPSQPQVLPTQLDLNAISTADAATAAALAPVTPPTLPPTWTPSPPPQLTPTETIAVPTSTPPGSNAIGTIFFIFNGDSIAALSGNGSSETLIVVGGAPADLTLSPDGTLLAYVAAGAGSAREVYISSLDGSYTQRISCLGFSRVLTPTWRPDSQGLAFFASQTPDGPLDVFSADVAGSGDCPNGNNQRQLTQVASQNLRDLTWNPSGRWLFFTDGAILAVDMSTSEVFPPLSHPSGFGPDFSLAHNPRTNQLYYLKTGASFETGQTGGNLYLMDTTEVVPNMNELKGAELFARQIRWNSDGSYLIISTDTNVMLLGSQSGTSVEVVTGSAFAPQPTLSPDSEFVAYVDSNPQTPTIQQVFIVDRLGVASRQITNHQEGTIEDLVWSAG